MSALQAWVFLVLELMKLIELRDKIDNIIKETPSWANCERIGIVTESYDDGSKDMLWLENFRTICCDGQGMVAFELVIEE